MTHKKMQSFLILSYFLEIIFYHVVQLTYIRKGKKHKMGILLSEGSLLTVSVNKVF